MKMLKTVNWIESLFKIFTDKDEDQWKEMIMEKNNNVCIYIHIHIIYKIIFIILIYLI